MRETNEFSLLAAVTEVSQEREIDRDILITAIENSILQAAQRKYTNFDNIEVSFDRKTGEVLLQQYKVVVNEVEDADNEITLIEAQHIDSSAEIGDEIAYPISSKNFSNTIAQATRHILFGKVRDIEKEIINKKFAGKLMEIVHGKVARIEANRVYVILNTNVEGILERDEMLWNDKFQSGELIRALLLDIKPEGRQHSLILSRTHPTFLERLLKVEIPEIYDGSIKIVDIAREAGRKSKVVVKSEDDDIDPVGACIGPRGSRISPIITELNGERIDIMAYKDNPAESISEALNVDGIKTITIDEGNKTAFVEISSEFLPAAIGKKGQNVRLAQKICGYQIKFVGSSQEEKRKELLSGLFKDDPATVKVDAPSDSAADLTPASTPAEALNTEEAIAEVGATALADEDHEDKVEAVAEEDEEPVKKITAKAKAAKEPVEKDIASAKSTKKPKQSAEDEKE